ncbi:MAG TPA: cytochrome c oxidase assembly protein [Gemmatimonadaceae bacterium]|nr:cytochrome c oxidase assembly protein [Gemmatimonadaceae bacterium]
MQWWCSAQGVAWEWTWRAYPGVWLFIALVGAALAYAHRRSGVRTQPWRVSLMAQGVLALWIALDWPVGALGGGYLASLHMLQFLLIALVAPPLILLGIHEEVWDRLARRAVPRWLTAATTPLLGLVTLNAVIVLTHLPAIADPMMATQLGSFAIDMLWLASGTLFWWPLVAPVPARPRFVPPLRMGYLVLGIMFSPVTIVLVAVLVFNEHPLFATYELAPRVGGLDSVLDHQIAGLLMSVGGAVITLVGMTTIFFRWARESEGVHGPDANRGVHRPA